MYLCQLVEVEGNWRLHQDDIWFFLFLWQEAAWTVTDECIQVMGGMGFMKVSV